MNATELLKQDHREVESMIAELEGAGSEGGAAYVNTFQQLKQALTLHTQIEEQLLYPALEDFEETTDLVEESYDEHDEVDQILNDMTGLNPADEEFQELLAQLKDSIEQHVEEEESELFPQAEELLGEDALETMGNQIEQMKGEALGGGGGSSRTAGV
jgi:hemerythrin superfamily protein